MSHSDSLSLFSWNINGNVSKLELSDVYSVYSLYDIVILSELKTAYKIDVPGYVPVRSSVIDGEGARGGVLVLFKNYLWPRVYVKQVLKDQVWFTVHPFNLMFGACYVAPSDSSFFDPASFCHIQEECIEGRQEVLVLGDLNARLGDLSPHADPRLFSYTANPDTSVNANGRELSNLCRSCNLVPVNHMVCQNVVCEGGLTFRRGGSWVSQLDWALVSKTSVNVVNDFRILKEVELPSDHAPIAMRVCLTAHLPESLLQRAQQLSRDQDESGTSAGHTGRKPIQFHRVSTALFLNNLPDPNPLLMLSEENPAELCAAISETLYQACRSAKEPPCNRASTIPGPRSAYDRWHRLLESGDHQSIWKAVNWKGDLTHSSQPAVFPSEEQFIEHYSALLNPGNLTDDSGLVCPDVATYCPVLDDPISGSEVYRSIKRLAPDKAPGPDGVPPGVLKFIPPSWVPLLVCLFNIVFEGCYPAQ